MFACMTFELTDPFGDHGIRRVAAVTDEALAQLSVDDLLDELLERVRDLLKVDTAAVLLLDHSSQSLVATAAKGIEEEVRQGVRIPMRSGFAGRIAAERHPIILEHVDSTNVWNPLLWRKGIRSLLGVPMVTEGTVVGVLHVGTLSPRRFTDEDVKLLQLVATRAALATRARLSDADRAAAGTLQRSLLPYQLPTLPGLDVAARYVAGEGGVGGDWYDVFHLPSGALCLVVGDVIGRGLNAAVVMGRLRSDLRAYSLDTEDPATLLAKLDRNVHHFGPDTLATVVCAVIEPSLDVMSISVAGHLPPIMVGPDDEASVLDLKTDLAIGAVPDQVRHSNRITFEPGSVLCLYTDGLVERRDEPIDERIELLRRTISADRAETVCASVMYQLVGNQHVPDDIALLSIRRLPR
ncbi:GAF domain-containing protein [Actinopolymorpha singaporensis]|uniref:GAF domain-containing protein n=2 Tax=Actinopolymorpha singaporensis TaxID=117157 RepID=A0A1H1MQP3_9ACTN|nr:GAF domain-containing protein [Actinopolymorpha singaporensis]